MTRCALLGWWVGLVRIENLHGAKRRNEGEAFIGWWVGIDKCEAV